MPDICEGTMVTSISPSGIDSMGDLVLCRATEEDVCRDMEAWRCICRFDALPTVTEGKFWDRRRARAVSVPGAYWYGSGGLVGVSDSKGRCDSPKSSMDMADTSPVDAYGSVCRGV